MRAVGLIFAVLMAVWLQISWFGHMRPLGVMPNVVLIVVVLTALRANASSALAVAVGGGWLLDLASGDGTFGLRIAFYVATVLAIITARQLGLQAESAITGLVLIALATLLYDAAVLATIGLPTTTVIMQRVGADVLVTAGLAGLVYIGGANIGNRGRPSMELGPRLS